MLSALALILLPGLYNFVTGGYFLCRVLLPVLSWHSSIPLAADSATLSLLSGKIAVNGLRVGGDAAPVFRCERLSAECAWLLLPWKLDLANFELDGARISLTRGNDGDWEAAFMNAGAAGDVMASERKSAASKQRKALFPSYLRRARIERVAVRNLSLIYEDAAFGTHLDLRGFSLDILNVRPGGHASLAMESGIAFSGDGAEIADSRFGIRVNVNFRADGMPEFLRVKAGMKVGKGSWNGMDLAGKSLTWISRAAFTERHFSIPEFRLEQSHGSVVETGVDGRASGTLSPFTAEYVLSTGRMPSVLMAGLERFMSPWRPGDVSMDMDGGVSVHESLTKTHVKLKLKHRAASGVEHAFPSSDFELSGAVSLDRDKRKVLLKDMRLLWEEAWGEVLNLNLSTPFAFRMDAAAEQLPSYPELAVKVNNFNLAYINMFIDKDDFEFSSGRAGLELRTRGDSDRGLTLADGKAWGRGVGFNAPGYRVGSIDLDQTMSFSFKDYRRIRADAVRVALSHEGQPLTRVAADGELDIPGENVSWSATVSEINNGCFRALPQAVSESRMFGELFRRLGGFGLTVKALCGVDFKTGIMEFKRADARLEREPGGVLHLSLGRPWGLHLAGDEEVLKQSLSFGIMLENFDPVFVGMFLPGSIMPRRGILNGDAGGSVGFMDGSVKCGGAFVFSDIDADLYGLKLVGAGLKPYFDVRLEEWKRLRINKFECLILASGNKEAGGTALNGYCDFSSGAYKFNAGLSSMNHELVRLFQPDFPLRFVLDGDIGAEAASGFGYPALKGSLNARGIAVPGLEDELSAILAAELMPERGWLAVRRFDCKLGSKGEGLTDFRARGRIAVPMASGTSRLELNSTRLDLGLLETILTAGRKESGGGGQLLVKDDSVDAEPGAVAFKGTLELVVNLGGIVYGSGVEASLDNAVILMRDGAIKLSPSVLKVNGAPVRVSGMIDAGIADGYPFEMMLGCAGIEAGPLFRAFAPESGMDVAVELKDFNLSLKGKGFTQRNIERGLSGSLKSKVGRLEIPDSLRSVRLARLLLLPVEAAGQVMKYREGTLERSLGTAHDIYDNIDTLRLDRGIVELLIDDGMVLLKNCEFSGGSFVRKLRFSGFVPLDPDLPMRVKSDIELLYLEVPLEIGGTYRDPIPDINRMLAVLVPVNMLKMLEMRPVRSLIDGSLKGGRSLLENAGEVLRDGWRGPQPQAPARKKTDASREMQEILGN